LKLKKKNEGVHIHHDLRFFFVASNLKIELKNEVVKAKWIPLKEVSKLDKDGTLTEMASRSLDFYNLNKNKSEKRLVKKTKNRL
jgi:hypothetical protein